jgi:PIN domain nuclease of toxin-antitoxin system
MRLLLDTHVLIWWLVDSPRLSRDARAAIADPGNAVSATPVSAYEIANKERLGRLPGRLTTLLPQVLRKGRISIHPLTFDHALVAGQLPGPHRDPWDRLIIAQAMAAGLTVVTTDAVFRDYGVPVCW